MSVVRKAFEIGYSSIALLFFVCALALVWFASIELWHGIVPEPSATPQDRFNSILEAVGLLTIAVVALELSQTMVEEEVQRKSDMSTPTRVRRFLSRFLIVVVVALSIETLVGVFRFVHEDPAHLPHAAMVGLAAAALLIAWGVFVKLNTSAEEMEPEAMAEVKSEDREAGAAAS